MFRLVSRRSNVAAFRSLSTEPLKPSIKSWNLNKMLDKKHECKSLKEIIELPLSALQGLDHQADAVFEKLKIRSIKQLGTWKAYKLASAITKVASFEDSYADMDNFAPLYNLEKGIDKKFHDYSFHVLVDAPLSSIKVHPYIPLYTPLLNSKVQV